MRDTCFSLITTPNAVSQARTHKSNGSSEEPLLLALENGSTIRLLDSLAINNLWNELNDVLKAAPIRSKVVRPLVLLRPAGMLVCADASGQVGSWPGGSREGVIGGIGV